MQHAGARIGGGYMRKQTMLLTALLIAITIAVGSHYTLYAGTFDPDIEQINFSIEDAVTGGPAVAGTLAGVASAQARITNGFTGDTQSPPLGGPDAQVAPAAVELVIVKLADVDIVIAGENITYTIAVANTSVDTDATGAFITDTLPVGVSFVSSFPVNTCAHDTGEVTCNVGNGNTLIAGAASVNRFIVVTVDVDTPEGTVLVNTAQLTTNEGTEVTTAETTVADTTAPVVTAPADVTVEANTEGGASDPELGTATVIDNVDPNPILTD
jgi:uncharacterized repeat protein (TIGR01451 family)